MKTLLATINSENPIIFDNKKDDCYELDPKYGISIYDLKGIYMIPEDMQIKYQVKAGQYTIKNANKGDVLIIFRNSKYVHKVAVIKNNEFKENMLICVKDRENVLSNMQTDLKYSDSCVCKG